MIPDLAVWAVEVTERREEEMGRRFKFDRGDWVAVRSHSGEWRLAGRVVDADSESCCVEDKRGLRSTYVPGEDAIARVRWQGRGRWTV